MLDIAEHRGIDLENLAQLDKRINTNAKIISIVSQFIYWWQS